MLSPTSAVMGCPTTNYPHGFTPSEGSWIRRAAYSTCCILIYIHTCRYVCLYIYNIHICIDTCIFICTYVYIYNYMYIQCVCNMIYIYAHIHKHHVWHVDLWGIGATLKSIRIWRMETLWPWMGCSRERGKTLGDPRSMVVSRPKMLDDFGLWRNCQVETVEI